MIRAVATILSFCALSSGLAASISTNGMRDLASFLAPKQNDLELPAIAAAVVQKDRVVAAGATGERKAGSGISVTLNDKFHIGSCTKSMTALLAVELASEG